MEDIPRHSWRTSPTALAAVQHASHGPSVALIIIIVIAVAALGLVTRWRP